MSETKTPGPHSAVNQTERAPNVNENGKAVPIRPHAEHGALIDHDVPQEDAVQAQPKLLWSRIRHYFRDPLSEFFGVFILILFGDGVVAQVVLSNGTKGSYQSISWGWG
jgi:aquaglyceroporin related protein, other eukaryote